jgi:hypothetical protein
MDAARRIASGARQDTLRIPETALRSSHLRDLQQGSAPMTKLTYEIVQHDGGWAYRADGTFSETFPSHDAARQAAERAAQEQIVPGDSTPISYEDDKGRWHDELSAGDDRPETDVEG